MSEKLNVLSQLADILLNVFEANKGEPMSKDGTNLDAEGLTIKYFNHLLSAIYLAKGINIDDISVPIKNYFDHTSVDVLVRSAFETCLVFHHVFIDPSDSDEAEFRFLSWWLAGLYNRHKYPAITSENIAKQNKEKLIIDRLRTRIKVNAYFTSLVQKKQDKFLRSIEVGRWKRLGWTEIALTAGFSETNSRVIYSLLSDRAHSGNNCIKQVWQAKNPVISRKLMRASLGHLGICTAMMIKHYCQYAPPSKKYYSENYKEPNIVTLWIEVGIERNINSIFDI